MPPSPGLGPDILRGLGDPAKNVSAGVRPDIAAIAIEIALISALLCTAAIPLILLHGSPLLHRPAILAAVFAVGIGWLGSWEFFARRRNDQARALEGTQTACQRI